MPQEQYWGSLSTKTVYEALAYIGQTIIVVNNSDAEMTLIGYTQLDFPTQDKYFVRGYGAIVTCYLTGSKYCRISWNGSVRRFLTLKTNNLMRQRSNRQNLLLMTRQQQKKNNQKNKI